MSSILGLQIAATDYCQLIAQSRLWAAQAESRAVFFANVHVVMEAYDDAAFREALNKADLICPDGVPLVWALRSIGHKSASRVYGPDSMLALLKAAEEHDIPVGFYGSRDEVLKLLLDEVCRRFPRLRVVYSFSPPFRAPTHEEDLAICHDVAESGARFLFVGLGCPKQERWVMEHVNRIPAVMFGVGAAFDFVAGTTPQAPRWMMRSGLEWAFRLLSEPRRLMRRYARHNPRFVLFFLKQKLLSPRSVSGTH